MASERPTVDALRVEIGMQNADLLIFASENARAGLMPFNETLAAFVIDKDITPEEIDHHPAKPFAYFFANELDIECVRTAAVMSRHIDTDNPQEGLRILKRQLDTVRRVHAWMKDPDRPGKMTTYEKESCTSFLTAVTSFTWHEDFERLRELEGIVVNLSLNYGRIYNLENRREE